MHVGPARPGSVPDGRTWVHVASCLLSLRCCEWVLFGAVQVQCQIGISHGFGFRATGKPWCGKRSGAQGPMWGVESLNGARPFDVLPDRRIRTLAQMARHLGNRKRFAGYGFVIFPALCRFLKMRCFLIMWKSDNRFVAGKCQTLCWVLFCQFPCPLPSPKMRISLNGRNRTRAQARDRIVKWGSLNGPT
jgi:hypothetical protein